MVVLRTTRASRTWFHLVGRLRKTAAVVQSTSQATAPARKRTAEEGASIPHSLSSLSTRSGRDNAGPASPTESEGARRIGASIQATQQDGTPVGELARPVPRPRQSTNEHEPLLATRWQSHRFLTSCRTSALVEPPQAALQGWGEHQHTQQQSTPVDELARPVPRPRQSTNEHEPLLATRWRSHRMERASTL